MVRPTIIPYLTPTSKYVYHGMYINHTLPRIAQDEMILVSLKKETEAPGDPLHQEFRTRYPEQPFN